MLLATADPFLSTQANPSTRTSTVQFPVCRLSRSPVRLSRPPVRRDRRLEVPGQGRAAGFFLPVMDEFGNDKLLHKCRFVSLDLLLYSVKIMIGSFSRIWYGDPGNEVWPSIEGLNCTVTPFQVVFKYFKRMQHFVIPGALAWRLRLIGTVEFDR